MSNLKEKCALHFLDFFDAIFTHVHPLLKWSEWKLPMVVSFETKLPLFKTKLPQHRSKLPKYLYLTLKIYYGSASGPHNDVSWKN